jgi:hypothetical protein
MNHGNLHFLDKVSEAVKCLSVNTKIHGPFRTGEWLAGGRLDGRTDQPKEGREPCCFELHKVLSKESRKRSGISVERREMRRPADWSQKREFLHSTKQQHQAHWATGKVAQCRLLV